MGALLFREGHNLWGTGDSLDYICLKNNLQVSFWVVDRNRCRQIFELRICDEFSCGFRAVRIESPNDIHHSPGFRVLDARNQRVIDHCLSRRQYPLRVGVGHPRETPLSTWWILAIADVD